MNVLNSQLYDALCKLFDDDVSVASEGDLGQYHHQAAESCFKGRRFVVFGQVFPYGEKYLVNCPVCGDHKHRLAICYAAGASMPHPKAKTRRILFPWQSHMHCAHDGCNQRELVGKLLQQLPADYESTALQSAATRPRQSANVSIAQMEIHLPTPHYDLGHEKVPSECLDYLTNVRHFDPGGLTRDYQCRYVPPGALYDTRDNPADPEKPIELRTQNPRLLIPIIQHHKLMAWQLRALVTGVEPKYLNPLVKPGRFPKGAWLYNFDSAALNKDVILFEGIPNVWRFGEAGMALCGKFISTDQINILKFAFSYDGCGVVCLDEDTYPQNLDLLMADKLRHVRAFRRGVSVLRLRGGDSAEHTTRRMHQLFWLAVTRATNEHGAALSATYDENEAPLLTPDMDIPVPQRPAPRVIKKALPEGEDGCYYDDDYWGTPDEQPTGDIIG